MNQCKDCGAGNDAVLTNCAYCGAQLEAQTDINSLPEIELIEKCSHRIVEFESLTKDYQRLSRAKQFGQFENLPLFGKMATKFSYDGTLAAAHRYLDQLEVRSQHNEALREKIVEFKSRIETAKKEEKKTSKKGLLWTVAGVGLGVGLVGLLFGGMSYRLEQEQKSDDLRAHITELKKIEDKVDQAISSQNYDYALALIERLSCTDQLCTERQVKQFDEKRERLRSAVAKMAN